MSTVASHSDASAVPPRCWRLAEGVYLLLVPGTERRIDWDPGQFTETPSEPGEACLGKFIEWDTVLGNTVGYSLLESSVDDTLYVQYPFVFRDVLYELHIVDRDDSPTEERLEIVWTGLVEVDPSEAPPVEDFVAARAIWLEPYSGQPERTASADELDSAVRTIADYSKILVDPNTSLPTWQASDSVGRGILTVLGDRLWQGTRAIHWDAATAIRYINAALANRGLPIRVDTSLIEPPMDDFSQYLHGLYLPDSPLPHPAGRQGSP